MERDASHSRVHKLGDSDYYDAKGCQMLDILKGFDLAQTLMQGVLPSSQTNLAPSDLSRLHDALSALPETYVNWKYLKWAKILVAADPDGLLGYRARYPYAAKVYPRIKGFIDLRKKFSSMLYRTVDKRIKDTGGERRGRNWRINVDAVTGEMADEWEPKISDAVRQLDQMSAEVPDGDSRFQFDNFKRDIDNTLKRIRAAKSPRGNSTNAKNAVTVKNRAKDVEKLMKTIILPQCTFRPPDTILTVVDFMRKKSRELDPRNIPDNQRGIGFAITFPPEKTIATIPDFCETNISMWKALKALCKNAKPTYKFEISDNGSGVVVVKPLSTP